MLVVLAILFGFVAGLRTFTAPAAYFLWRGGTPGYVLAAFALIELVMDAHPKAPSRTQPMGLIPRLVSGGIVGWFIAGGAGAATGVLGAIIGTYGGHAVRLRLIQRFGPIPAALIEDAVAILLAVYAVTRL
ncbi:MAG TPA: hypothetical protein VMH02_10690 [Verrucomicrobiae bacterium]|nr:hypothetical protein [Verrucomicrobiae bacterium]